MASSSVSQDDIENDFERFTRRSKIRIARAHKITPPSKIDSGMIGDDEGGDTSHGGDVGNLNASDHDISQKPPSAVARKDKRVIRSNHMNKGKAQRDRRKLREKRRSTGVVHLPSTESTGGSTGEDDDEEVIAGEVTRKNTQHNEFPAEPLSRPCQDSTRGNLNLQQTSASDLEADDEENGGSGTPSSTNNDDLLATSSRLAESAATSASAGHRRGQHTFASTSAAASSSRPSEDVLSLLEKSLEENQKLSRLLESRGQEIAALEAAVRQLKTQLGQVSTEASRLKEENAALIKAMGSLTTN